MYIALPDPESPHDHSFNHTNEAPLKPPTCYFGVYPHGMAKEGTVIKILSWEHLDSEC
jgi:hypothetical protein